MLISVAVGSLAVRVPLFAPQKWNGIMRMVSIAESLRTWSNDTKVSFHGEPVLN